MELKCQTYVPHDLDVKADSNGCYDESYENVTQFGCFCTKSMCNDERLVPAKKRQTTGGTTTVQLLTSKPDNEPIYLHTVDNDASACTIAKEMIVGAVLMIFLSRWFR